jgi:hypothetical protein
MTTVSAEHMSAQKRQQELVAAFSERYPELAEAAEIFGVGEAICTDATIAAEPATTTASNLTVSS